MSGLPNQLSIIQELESLLSQHPLFLKAKSQPWCHSDLLFLSAEDINRCRLDQKGKNALIDAVKRPDRRIRALMVMTADEMAEALSGTGDSYMFCFHPTKQQLLHAETGRWRS